MLTWSANSLAHIRWELLLPGLSVNRLHSQPGKSIIRIQLAFHKYIIPLMDIYYTLHSLAFRYHPICFPFSLSISLNIYVFGIWAYLVPLGNGFSMESNKPGFLTFVSIQCNRLDKSGMGVYILSAHPAGVFIIQRSAVFPYPPFSQLINASSMSPSISCRRRSFRWSYRQSRNTKCRCCYTRLRLPR